MEMGTYPKSRASIVALVLLMLICFFAGDRLFAAAANRLLMKTQSRLSLLYSGNLDHEIWIAGNSRAAKSFDARMMFQQSGRKTINLGVNGIRPAMLHAMLSDALELNRPPSFLILEISYLKNDWSDSQALELLPFVNYGIETERLLRNRLPKEVKAADLIHLRRYGGQQFFRSLTYLKNDDQQPASRRRISDESLDSIADRPEESFATSPESVQGLTELIRLCNQIDVKLYLVLAPYLDSYCDKVTNLSDWGRGILPSSMSHEERNLSYSYNDYPATKWLSEPKWFTDHVHLNREGQAEFTMEILSELDNR